MSLTQVELAAVSAVAERTVRDIEAGRTSVTLDVLARVAAGLGLTAVDLLTDGPVQCDVSFAVHPGQDLGALADLEPRVGRAFELLLADHGRVSVWPWQGSGQEMASSASVLTRPGHRLTVRVTAAALPRVVALAGMSLDVGPGLALGLPTVSAVRHAETLRVLVRARTPSEAQSRLRALTTRAQCCPRIEVLARRPLVSGSGYLARARAVPRGASARLQQVRAPGPDGLWVPA